MSKVLSYLVCRVKVDEGRTLLAPILRTSPGSRGRGRFVFPEVVGESICVEELLGTTLSSDEFAEDDHYDKSIMILYFNGPYSSFFLEITSMLIRHLSRRAHMKCTLSPPPYLAGSK